VLQQHLELLSAEEARLKTEENKIKEEDLQLTMAEQNHRELELKSQRDMEEKKRLEHERRTKELEDQQKKQREEEERKRLEEENKRQKEEQRRKEEEDRRKRDEEERLRLAEERRKQAEEEERKRQSELEQQRLNEERRIQQEKMFQPNLSMVQAQLPVPPPTKTATPVVVYDNNNFTPPPEWQKLVGWCGNISRVEAEQKLKGCPKGSFLLRWSDHAKSYVLSYVKPVNVFIHVARIVPSSSGTITVETEENVNVCYTNLLDFITQTINKGIISLPIA